jgi:HD-GYP domain-containing protein (c-di-GMP phosphodiesterase class II)
MVDLALEDEPVMLGLSTIRDYDDYTFTHSINVAILSMCLGKRIGISRTSLHRLGMCGVFHDLGKLDIPIEIINQPGELSESEFEEIKKHTIYSVTRIIKLQAARDLKATILLPPFEHHLKYDLSGYPKTNRKKPVGLFSRILTVTDVFDAITSPRIYRPSAFSPDQALGWMLGGAGTDFDPILLKVFINMLGVYPIGSLLELDTGELGLVMDKDTTFDGARPMVVLLAADGNGDYTRVGVADLTERDAQSGAFRRNIVKSLHPSTRGIQPAEFLI